jgi:hypothetical protein
MGAFMPPADSVIVRMVARRPAQFSWKQIPYSTEVNAILFGNTLHFSLTWLNLSYCLMEINNCSAKKISKQYCNTLEAKLNFT